MPTWLPHWFACLVLVLLFVPVVAIESDDKDIERLFVANLSNDSLDIVDLKAGKLLKQIPGQGKIQGVAYAPELDRLFVGNGQDGVCNVFDGKDYSLLRSFKLPDADNVRYDPKSA